MYFKTSKTFQNIIYFGTGRVLIIENNVFMRKYYCVFLIYVKDKKKYQYET